MALVTVNDQELETFGRFKLQCAFDGKNFEHNFVITGGIMEECIVGMDAINDQGMIIDCMIIDCMIIEVFLALDSFLTLRVR